MSPSPRALLDIAKAPAFLVTNLVNIRYLTGVSVSFGYLLILPRQMIFFVDGRYTEMAAHSVADGISVRMHTDIDRYLKKVPICAFEEDHVTVSDLRKWKTRFADTKFVRASDVVESFRRIKSPEELKHIRRAHRITEELLRRVPSALRIGTTERALVWKLKTWAQELGADGMAFEPVVAFGTHTSEPHHQATTRALQKGHIVLVDVGAMYKGYCADRCQTFFTEEPTPVQKRVFAAVQDALSTVLDASKQGMSTKKLDALAREVLRKHGVPDFPHALGHGVGMEVHEGVTLSPRSQDEKLQKSEVIALEPAVYFPGKFGIRLEEMMVVK